MSDKKLFDDMVHELRRGSVTLCVLVLLREPLYGYNLIEVLNAEGIQVEGNTLYPLLRRLESQGLLASVWETGGSKPRKYYVATQAGNELAEELKAYYDRMTLSIQRIWTDEKG